MQLSSLRSVEKLCATNVAPAVKAISIGEMVVQSNLSGVDFVLKPVAERGDVCPFVNP